MARAIWQGSISFGLVEIPVALFPAESPHELGLSMLDKRDFSPIGYKRYNKSTQKEVEWANIVRGYEHTKGEYVVLSDVELKRANPALTQTVHILQFVDADEIDAIYYEKPYYLAPMSKKSRGYALLHATLKRTNTLGIARIAVHTREHVAAVGVRGPALVAYLLRFDDEIRDPDEIASISDVESLRVTPKEVAMAEKLVNEMKEKWRPEKFRDEYKHDVMKLVEKKISSGNIHALPKAEKDERAPRGEGRIIDLMPLLKKSIEGTRRSESDASDSRSSAKSTRATATRKRTARAKPRRVRRSA
jgi:DNA end-binding protein Ku